LTGLPDMCDLASPGRAALRDIDSIGGQNMELTHFNTEGRARMVDVSEKPATLRSATAVATVTLNAATYALVKEGRMKKGDVLAVSQVAGIMGAKRTHDLIPMCHPLALTGVDLSFETDDEKHVIRIAATARCKGETGVEMEALTAAGIAALTIYDMCKAVQRDIVISDIHLLEKHGGKSGDFYWEDRDNG
jgi:cyclic pyranopterin phosphate synthase